ncbi:LexA family protein [Breznakia pachnodae]|uniref:Repressor LexA n=1 Tax=Breznakia pachnodae TaxID=265178 RepID=A0ABU0DXW0_9FIRM|nr:S24 family peptidase [Breznakia pachnodae]MDQ0359467.1 repressor LexA [Breznakia pachnodae]
MNVDIIRTQMTLLGLTPQEVAKQLDVGVSSVYRWLDGSTKKIPKDKLERLATVLRLSASALQEDTKHLVKPIIGTVKAGYNLYANEDILGYEEVSDKEAREGDYYLKVSGDSMTGDGIFEGDLVFVRKAEEVPNNAIAVVMIEEEVTIKRVLKKDDLLILEASNPQVENKIFNKSEIELLPVKIIGHVLHVKRSFV